MLFSKLLNLQKWFLVLCSFHKKIKLSCWKQVRRYSYLRLKTWSIILISINFTGSFELAVIRMSRYMELSSNHVLFVGEHSQMLEKSFMLPLEAFTTSGNTEEMTLVSQIFDCAKSIAELKLSEVSLSLYSAYILLQSGKNFHVDLSNLISKNNWTLKFNLTHL